MIRGCIFDLDGTLVNTLEDLADATNAALIQYGYAPRTYQEYRNILGNGVIRQIKRAMYEQETYFQDILDYYYIYYAQHCFDKSRPYEGIEELLQDLSANDIKICCITNKPQRFAEEILERLFPDIPFEVVGGMSERPLKPDPTSTLQALEHMSLSLNECVFIGDTYVDMETGRRAGMKTIGCLWGFRDIDELQNAGADAIVNQPNEIKELIDAWNKCMSGR